MHTSVRDHFEQCRNDLMLFKWNTISSFTLPQILMPRHHNSCENTFHYTSSFYVSIEHHLWRPKFLWSCVFFTVDCVTGTPMALKVLPKASTKLQGFLREYCISLHLSCHPCIVGLFGIAFQSNEHYGFAQELVTGRDLFAIIQPRVGAQTSSDLSLYSYALVMLALPIHTLMGLSSTTAL